MNKSYILLCAAVFCLVFVFAAPQNTEAYVIEELYFQDEGDIVVGPGKTELWLSPGDTVVREILISNRSGGPRIINISVEDFQGSKTAGGTIEFLGGEKGPYSLIDYVKPELEKIILTHGQRLRLPITVSIPETAEPGGLYGAVMISASTEEEAEVVEPDKAGTKMKVITRVASLFFVRVKGEVFEAGVLHDFKADKQFYEKGPVAFKILFENTGNVHLSPYGSIDIKNILGANIGQVDVDPWFVMPKSVRTREVKWNSNFLFGRYTAVLTLNRGYNDIVDTKEFSFWVIPWKIVLIGVVGLILIIWLFVWFLSNFEFRRKKDDDNIISPRRPDVPLGSGPSVPPRAS